jgi:hypothetical protein
MIDPGVDDRWPAFIELGRLKPERSVQPKFPSTIVGRVHVCSRKLKFDQSTHFLADIFQNGLVSEVIVGYHGHTRG